MASSADTVRQRLWVESRFHQRPQRRGHLALEQALDPAEIEGVAHRLIASGGGEHEDGCSAYRAIQHARIGRASAAQAVGKVEFDAACERDLAGDVFLERQRHRLGAKVAAGLDVVQEHLQAGGRRKPLDGRSPILVVGLVQRAARHGGVRLRLLQQPRDAHDCSPKAFPQLPLTPLPEQAALAPNNRTFSNNSEVLHGDHRFGIQPPLRGDDVGKYDWGTAPSAEIWGFAE
jgi:hypothetical protein